MEVNFKSSHHCKPDECDFAVQWVDSGQRVNVTLSAAVSGNTKVWAAVGFSDSRNVRLKMNDVLDSKFVLLRVILLGYND